MRSCSTPLDFGGSGPMSFRDCEHVWRREWLCTISASGSMSNSVAPGWPSLTCSDGDLITHTKRLSLRCDTSASSQDSATGERRKEGLQNCYLPNSPLLLCDCSVCIVSVWLSRRNDPGWRGIKP